MRMPIIHRNEKMEYRPMRTLLDDFIKNAFHQPTNDEKMMAVDIVEQDKEFILTANLPGIKKKDIKVFVEGNDLVIEAKQFEEKKEEQETMYSCERYQGNYRRAFTIQDNWDCDNMYAKYEDGVLKINIPKMQPKPEKSIKIS